MAMWVSGFKNLRCVTVIMGVTNILIIFIGGVIVLVASSSCGRKELLPFVAVSLAAGVRIGAMIEAAIAQEAAARTILESPAADSAVDIVVRNERRMRYKKWLWWTRFGSVITVLQLVGAMYLMFNVAEYIADSGTSNDCFLGVVSNRDRWKQNLLVVFMIMACFVVLLQCFAGTDILRWRSFYASQDDAWKSHYREVFDHGIREALCCLGRAKYMSVLEEDEVYSVARLLGDLVAYRASGTGHLELLAGLALLQSRSQTPKSYEGFREAPEEHIREAAVLHKFAEAAYTGPLLDFGRNPIIFPCAWLYRQGVLNPWTRNRRPVLYGDNWWRGHAAAFLKFVNLSPEVLRRGRVSQAKREAAYFVVVLHHLKSVVIAVRGTETPEDLITDGLCSECILSAEDLDGLINGSHIHPDVKQRVDMSVPHYGHSGIVEAARDLFIQLEGNLENDDGSSESSGFLSSLVGAGCECDGYSVRVVGHSLGGAIAALLGIRLYRKYPNLHVYTYGPLPCVDSIIADACSEFVTSIVYDNEFSARLSVGSILRLRASAITALSQDTKTDTAVVLRLARQFLNGSNYQANQIEIKDPASDFCSSSAAAEYLNHNVSGNQYNSDSKGTDEEDQEVSLWNDAETKDSYVGINSGDSLNRFTDTTRHNTNAVGSFEDPITQFMEAIPGSENGSINSTQVFLPGLVIHIVRQQGSFKMPLWKGWIVQDRALVYKAYIANRECFKDIVVSPSMFLDHLPWRCQDALQKVLEARDAQQLSDVSQNV